MSDDKKTSVRGRKKQADEFEKLRAEAEFMDRQDAENAIHSPHGEAGISKEEPEQELGRRLQEAREAARLTQGELAERTQQTDSEGKGISRAVLSFYETGKSRPSPRELRMLCEALRVSPNLLIYGIEDPFNDLLEQARWGGFASTTPEYYAMVTYAFSRLHHHNQQDIMRLMNSLLLGWDDEWKAGEQYEKANKLFLDMADELRNLTAKRQSKKQK